MHISSILSNRMTVRQQKMKNSKEIGASSFEYNRFPLSINNIGTVVFKERYNKNATQKLKRLVSNAISEKIFKNMGQDCVTKIYIKNGKRIERKFDFIKDLDGKILELLEQKANPNVKITNANNTLWHLAYDLELKPETIEKCLDTYPEIDFNVKNTYGFTPSLCISYNVGPKELPLQRFSGMFSPIPPSDFEVEKHQKNYERGCKIFKSYINHGAAIDAKDRYGKMACDYFEHAKDSEMVQFCLEQMNPQNRILFI